MSQLSLWSDKPTNVNQLNWNKFADTIAEVITFSETPLTIGTFGTWGSGKTSLMQMVRDRLAKRKNFDTRGSMPGNTIRKILVESAVA